MVPSVSTVISSLLGLSLASTVFPPYAAATHTGLKDGVQGNHVAAPASRLFFYGAVSRGRFLRLGLQLGCPWRRLWWQ